MANISQILSFIGFVILSIASNWNGITGSGGGWLSKMAFALLCVAVITTGVLYYLTRYSQGAPASTAAATPTPASPQIDSVRVFLSRTRKRKHRRP